MRGVTASGLAAGAVAGRAAHGGTADGLVDAVQAGPPWRRPPGLILLLATGALTEPQQEPDEEPQ